MEMNLSPKPENINMRGKNRMKEEEIRDTTKTRITSTCNTCPSVKSDRKQTQMNEHLLQYKITMPHHSHTNIFLDTIQVIMLVAGVSELCSDQLCSDQLCSVQLFSDQLCSDQLFNDQLCSDQLCSDQLCSDQMFQHFKGTLSPDRHVD
jgi:hypothetical protein